MSESTQTTFEEASRCPKCGQPGEERGKKPAPNLKPGTELHVIYCVSKLCPWYDTMWYVQVNPDGSIPPATNHRGQKKVYEGFEGHDEEADNIIRQVRANIQRQRELETEEHTEIKNPNAR